MHGRDLIAGDVAERPLLKDEVLKTLMGRSPP